MDQTEIKTIGAEGINPSIVFTDSAAKKVSQLIEEEKNDSLKLRVFISGGGCSGFQYGFTFDETIETGDSQIENLGVTLLVDPMSVHPPGHPRYRKPVRHQFGSPAGCCNEKPAACCDLATVPGRCGDGSIPRPSGGLEHHFR